MTWTPNSVASAWRADDPAIPEQDLALWWDVVGRWQSPVWLASLALALAVVAASRALVRRREGERSARSLGRDAAALALAGLAGLALVAVTYALFRSLHWSVHPFFFSVGVAFHTAGLAVPGLLLLESIRARRLSGAALALVPLGLSSAMLFVEPNRVEALRAALRLPTLPKGSAIRVAHLSDLQTLWFSGREEAALALANDFDPDLVVITGDLTASGQHPVLVRRLHDWLARLRSRTSRYVVNGDSDPDFDALVRQAPGVTYLKDDAASVEVRGARLWLGGVDNRRRPPDALRCLEGAPADATKILLAHNPDYLLGSGGARAQLGLAGHTHGGQVRLPGLGPILTFTHLGGRYAEGVFTGADLDPNIPWLVESLSICPGVGMEGFYAPRVRLLCPPRVVLLTLQGP